MLQKYKNKDKDNKNKTINKNNDSIKEDKKSNNIEPVKAKKRDFQEKVIKFIQYDDLIKETLLNHRKEINELKLQKKELELYLIDFLEEMNNDIINYGESDVIKKVERQKKAPLNKEIMRKAIIEDMIKEKFIKSETQGEKIIEKMFESMENKRPVTNVVELKRKSMKPKGKK